jgi:hypothetical protein
MNDERRIVYVLKLRPLPGINPYRELRWVLKALLRQHGMRCIDLREERETGMSINEQRPGSGILFKNDRKQTDSSPDYKGKININGIEYQLSAWIKEGAKGKFMSLSAKINTKSAEVVVDNGGYDDQVPF